MGKSTPLATYRSKAQAKRELKLIQAWSKAQGIPDEDRKFFLDSNCGLDCFQRPHAIFVRLTSGASYPCTKLDPITRLKARALLAA